MYIIDNKCTFIIVIFITMKSILTSSSPLNKIFISESELDLDTFLTMKAEVCNSDGCFFPKKFYFVSDISIICPAGFDLKLAYKDQGGHYRVGSHDNSKKRVVNNCFRNRKKVTFTTTPNYMKPTP